MWRRGHSYYIAFFCFFSLIHSSDFLNGSDSKTFHLERRKCERVEHLWRKHPSKSPECHTPEFLTFVTNLNVSECWVQMVTSNCVYVSWWIQASQNRITCCYGHFHFYIFFKGDHFPAESVNHPSWFTCELLYVDMIVHISQRCPVVYKLHRISPATQFPLSWLYSGFFFFFLHLNNNWIWR